MECPVAIHERCSGPNTNNSDDAYKKIKNNIICGSLNVCGFKRKIKVPEFCSLIENFDIFCVNETKLDPIDIINVEGYNFLSQCRKQTYRRKSGGLGVFVKQSLGPYVLLVESDSDYIMWFKLERSLFKTDEDIHFGAVYVPPADSRFKNADETNIFEIEIINACVFHKYVFLMGDFNARVDSSQDYIDVSDFLRDRLEIDLDLNDLFDFSPALMK